MANKLSGAELVEQLKSLIESAGNKEDECRKFLQYVPEILFRETPVEYICIEKDYVQHSGKPDYIISARVQDDTHSFDCVRAYVWELKAPQCHVFEKDTETRVRPTKELIQAENQLLNYYEEMRENASTRTEFQVLHPNDICFGGIIIGCSRTLINGDFEAEKKTRLFQKAKRIRDAYFYARAGIKLLTWDAVLDQLLPKEEYVGQTKSDNKMKSMPMPKAQEDITVLEGPLPLERDGET